MINKLTKEQVEYLREEISGGSDLPINKVTDTIIVEWIEDFYDNDLEELLEDMPEDLASVK